MKQLLLLAFLCLGTACALDVTATGSTAPPADAPMQDAAEAGPACAPIAQDRCTPGCRYPLDPQTPVLGCRPNTYERVCNAEGQLSLAPHLIPGCDCEDGCVPDALPDGDELVAEVDRIRWTAGPSAFAGFRFFVGTPANPEMAGHWRDIVYTVTDWDPFPTRAFSTLMGGQVMSWNVFRRSGASFAFDVQRGFVKSEELGHPLISSVCTTLNGFPELGQVDAFRLRLNAAGAFDHEEALTIQRTPWPASHPELGWCFFSIDR